MDSTYRLIYSLPHYTDWLVLNFSASGISTNLAEESWGVDNVRVYVTPGEAPPKLYPMTITSTGFNLVMEAQPGWSYILQGSADLVNWTSLTTNRPSTSVVSFTDPAGLSLPLRFYRVIQAP